jgi:hypothetical protein
MGDNVIEGIRARVGHSAPSVRHLPNLDFGSLEPFRPDLS